MKTDPSTLRILADIEKLAEHTAHEIVANDTADLEAKLRPLYNDPSIKILNEKEVSKVVTTSMQPDIIFLPDGKIRLTVYTRPATNGQVSSPATETKA